MEEQKKETRDFLHIYQKNGTSKVYPLKTGKTTIGTSSTSDIRLKNEDKISCILESDISGVFVLTNDQQDNRIVVNDKFCNKYIVLKHGDYIDVGKQRFQYCTTDENKEDDLKNVHQSIQRQAGRKSVFLPLTRQGIPQSKQLALKNKTPKNNPLLNRRCSTGNRRTLVRTSVLNKSNKTPIEPRKSTLSSNTPISDAILNSRTRTSKEVIESNPHQSSASTSRTPVLRNLRSSDVTKLKMDANEDRVQRVSVSLTLPQDGAETQVNVSKRKRTFSSDNDVDTKRRSRSCELSTPRNNVSAISITPLKASKRSVNQSLIEDAKSSTPKSALKTRRSASLYRPIVEDISPVSPSLRPSTLQKPAFRQRRSVKLNATSESESADENTLNDSLPGMTRECHSHDMLAENVSNGASEKENSSRNTPSQVCNDDEDQEEDLTDEDIFKTPMPARRYIRRSVSRTSINNQPPDIPSCPSGTEDDSSDFEKPHRFGDSDIDSDLDVKSRRSSVNFSKKDNFASDMSSTTDEEENPVDLESAQNSTRRSSRRTINWGRKDSPTKNRDRRSVPLSYSSFPVNTRTSRRRSHLDDAIRPSAGRSAATRNSIRKTRKPSMSYNPEQSFHKSYRDLDSSYNSRIIDDGSPFRRRRSKSLVEDLSVNVPVTTRQSQPTSNFNDFNEDTPFDFVGASPGPRRRSYSFTGRRSRELSGQRVPNRMSQRLRRRSTESVGVIHGRTAMPDSFRSRRSLGARVENRTKRHSTGFMERSRYVPSSEFYLEDEPTGGNYHEKLSIPNIVITTADGDQYDDELTTDMSFVGGKPSDHVEISRRSLALIQDYSSGGEEDDDNMSESTGAGETIKSTSNVANTDNDKSMKAVPEAEILDIRQSASFERATISPSVKTPEKVTNESSDDVSNIRQTPSFEEKLNDSVNDEQKSKADVSISKDSETDRISNDIEYSNIDSSYEEEIEQSLHENFPNEEKTSDKSSSKQLIGFPENLEDAEEFMEAPVQEIDESIEEISSLRLSQNTTCDTDNLINDDDNQAPASPKNVLSDVRGEENIMETPRTPKSPSNDLTNPVGVKTLMATPRAPKSPLNDLTNPVGVKTLMATPRAPKSPLNDLTNPVGVKTLMATPKAPKSPLNDLTNPIGIKNIMATPRVNNSPKNDLTNVMGVKQIMATPKEPKSPFNDLTNPVSVKSLMATPRVPKSPKNDLTNVAGVKRIMATPKEPKSPLNDLTNPVGVKSLMASPRVQFSPKNDLTNVEGLKRVMATPKQPKSPLNDLTNPVGVKTLMATPKCQKSPKNDLLNVTGVMHLMATPHKDQSVLDDTTKNISIKTPEMQETPLDAFDSLKESKPIKTYSRTPNKSLQQTDTSPRSELESVEAKEVQDVEDVQETLENFNQASSSTPLTLENSGRSQRKRTGRVAAKLMAAKTENDSIGKGEISKETNAVAEEINATPLKTRTRRAKANKSKDGSLAANDESTTKVEDNQVLEPRLRKPVKKDTEKMDAKEKLKSKTTSRKGQNEEITEIDDDSKEVTQKPTTRARRNKKAEEKIADVEESNEGDTNTMKSKEEAVENRKVSVEQKIPTPLPTRGRGRRVLRSNGEANESQTEVPKPRTTRARNKKQIDQEKENEDKTITPRSARRNMKIDKENEKEETPKQSRGGRRKVVEKKIDEEHNKEIESVEEKKEVSFQKQETPKPKGGRRKVVKGKVDDEHDRKDIEADEDKNEESVEKHETPKPRRGRQKKIDDVPNEDEKEKSKQEQETPKPRRGRRNKIDTETPKEKKEDPVQEQEAPKRGGRRKKVEDKTDEADKEETIEKLVTPKTRGGRRKRVADKDVSDVSIQKQETSEPRSKRAKKDMEKKTPKLEEDDGNKSTSSKPSRAKKTKAKVPEKETAVKDIEKSGPETPQTSPLRRTTRRRMINNKYGEDEWVTPIKTPSKMRINIKKNASPGVTPEAGIRRSKRAKK